MSVYTLYSEQKLRSSQEEIWEFISDPSNLATITPPHMGFVIRNKDLPERMYPGMMISYWVRPLLGIRMNWLTEITHVEEPGYFVDEQRQGPYALWHHEHHLKPVEGGVPMQDRVIYRLPLGPLGGLAHYLFVGRQLRKIFAYREEVLHRLYNENHD